MRKTLYSIIEPYQPNATRLSAFYDYGMIFLIILSIIPLLFKEYYPIFRVIDAVCVAIFIIDYILRWITADYRFGKPGATAFFRYPFSALAIIDLLSILPLIAAVNGAFRALRLIRLLRLLSVLRAFKFFSRSKSFRLLRNAFIAQKRSLLVVLIFAVGYIFVSALIIFQVEPATFDNFFDALYWATISLTTVGYGDIYATSTAGQVITMVSALMGIAVIALPSGIITAGYYDELKKDEKASSDE